AGSPGWRTKFGDRAAKHRVLLGRQPIIILTSEAEADRSADQHRRDSKDRENQDQPRCSQNPFGRMRRRAREIRGSRRTTARPGWQPATKGRIRGNSNDLVHRGRSHYAAAKRRQGYGFGFKRWSANRVNKW